jgi:hypothetical protein
MTSHAPPPPARNPRSLLIAGALGAGAFVVLASGCMHAVGLDALGLDALAGTPVVRGNLGGWTSAPDLPRRTEMAVGQLVFHADFPLAGQHRLVRELDGLRTEVSQTLGLPVSDEPVHLYLFDGPARFEAFVAQRFPTFPARRAFFVETDTSLSVFAAWQDRVAEDLRHETTHGYVHAVVPTLPLWLDEGIAEFFELPRAEGGLHRDHVAHLAGRLLEGTWRPDLARLEAVSSAAELTQDHYAEAWCWVHWLLCTTPERRELLQDYLADVRRQGSTAPLSERLKRAPGMRGDPAAEVTRHVHALAGLTGAL